MFDRDRSGQIDLNEFQGLWTYINQWKAAFDQFDRDRSGAIDANELHNGSLDYIPYTLILLLYANILLVSRLIMHTVSTSCIPTSCIYVYLYISNTVVLI